MFRQAGAALCTGAAGAVMLSEGPIRTNVVLRIGFVFIQIRRAFRLELPFSAAQQQQSTAREAWAGNKEVPGVH